MTCLAQGPMVLGNNSLFNPQANSGILRRTARKKGDLLLVRVSEITKGQFKASTTATKDLKANVNKINIPFVDVFAAPALGNILGGSAQKFVNALTGGGSTGGTYSSAGGGEAKNDSAFTTTVSVLVTDVDDAGNLHIEGRRDLRVNKETQQIVLTGVVRPDDVALDNSVPSERVANAHIAVDGKGPVVEKTRRGLLGKITDWLF